MWAQLTQIFSHISYDSPHFPALVFLINLLGETGVPFPLVMEGVLLFAGYTLAQGHLAVGLLILAVSLTGSCTGANSLYWASRVAGKPLVVRVWDAVRLKRSWLHSAETRLSRATPLEIGVARLTPGLALPLSLTSGVLRVPWLKFTLGVALSELVWLGFFGAVGFAVGVAPVDVSPLIVYFPRVVFALVIGLGVVKLGRLAWQWFASRRTNRSLV
ncbi:MAG: VTT domain-containing protein [Chloroflexi bacterium]|nr:VTT domain-containing protein [Chloroflexota bacterium]